MLPPPFEKALVLTGPTGSGKTQLGIELAERMNAEIIAMDSMTLYRGMDIGTAKPSIADRSLIPHHLIDVREPWESASVAWWLDEARRCCAEIESRGKQVLFVGGTPLYLKALMCGLFDGPPADATIRRRLKEEAEAVGSAALHERLISIDPVTAARIHPNDVRRTIRALEVHELTGRPISAWQTQWPQESGVAAQKFMSNAVLCLEVQREELYATIDRRVETMFKNGLINEVRRVRELNPPIRLEASQAVGYKEVFDLLAGAITREEAVARVQARSRQLARRQLTWFRHLPGCQFVAKQLTWTLWQDKMNG
jgi:tRNA dimethylallyltransferase